MYYDKLNYSIGKMESATWRSDLYTTIQYLGVFSLGLIVGALTMVIACLCVFKEYVKHTYLHRNRSVNVFTPHQVGYLLHKNLTEPSASDAESGKFLNAVLDLLFKEWRDTADLQRWVLKKINIELIELMETKAAQKLLQAIKINNFDLGPCLPVIHGVRIVEPYSFADNKIPDAVVLDIDLEYAGGFFLAIDVDLVFNKSAFISFRIKRFSGTARILFGRIPCTHWAVSFLKEPVLEFDVDTIFESHQLPQLGNLITNQLHNLVRKKHTFPHYKLRYNPFFSFQHSTQTLFDQNVEEIQINFNHLEVTLVSCTRLMLPKRVNVDTRRVVYATLSLDAVPCTAQPLLKVALNDQLGKHNLQVSSSNTIQSPAIAGLANSTSFAGNLKPEASTSRARGKLRKRTKQLKSMPALVSAACVAVSMPGAAQSLAGDTRSKKRNDKNSLENVRNHSYIMVTRHFSATLHEMLSHKFNSVPSKTVNVCSITLNNSSPEHCGIIEGDRILEINGQKVASLSQTIAIIEAVRAKKEKFQFKVQRSRSASLKMNIHNTENVDEDEGCNALHPPSPVSVKQEYTEPPSLDDIVFDGVVSDKERNGLKKKLQKNDLSPEKNSSESDTESDYSQLDSDALSEIMEPEDPLAEAESCTTSLPEVHESSANIVSTSLRGHNSASNPAFASDVRSESPFHLSRIHGNLNFARVTEDLSNRLYGTSLFDASASTSYGWKNETFRFNVTSSQKYLNIRFWLSDRKKLSDKNEKLKPVLVGNTAVALCELELLCNLVTSKTFTRRYKVSAPVGYFKLNIDDSFSRRSAFRKEYCFGDVTLTAQIN